MDRGRTLVTFDVYSTFKVISDGQAGDEIVAGTFLVGDD